MKYHTVDYEDRGCFTMTPRQLAITLKTLGYSDVDVANSLYQAFVDNNVRISALDLGAVLLDKDVYPQTESDRMYRLLTSCHGPAYDSESIRQALGILYPHLFEVKSESEFYMHNQIVIKKREIVTIDYVRGQWRVLKNSEFCDADGDASISPTIRRWLTGVNIGALIGEFEDAKGHYFLIGKHIEIPMYSNVDRTLHLYPNFVPGLEASGEGSLWLNITRRLR